VGRGEEGKEGEGPPLEEGVGGFGRKNEKGAVWGKGGKTFLE